MCGIVGFVGKRPAQPILLNGLKRLEYRGYDSAGAAVIKDGELDIRRTVGRVGELEAFVRDNPLVGTTGIAHTRWATHGRPTERNAHPHCDASGRIALVHNGIIENHAAIRSFLEGEGITFLSETDTEALVQLIGYHYRSTADIEESTRLALTEAKGTFGVAVLCADVPGQLIVARRGSPLIVGIGDGEYVVASDASAIIEHTSQVMYLGDNELLVLSAAGISAKTLDQRPVEKQIDTLQITLDEIELGDFPHHMLKEIHEQPRSLRDALAGRTDLQRAVVTLGGLKKLERQIAQYRQLLMFGCGTAWHACLVAEYLFEELARIPTNVEYASELRYRNPIVEEGTLAIAVSQSGETADTLSALQEVKMKGATAFGVVNAVGSSIARETDAGVYLHAGPEIGVASTKAFTAQVAVLALIALDMGRRRHLSQERALEYLEELQRIPKKVEKVLAVESQVLEIAAMYRHRENWLYLGRGVNYPVALEGALKLKEISYIHAEGMPAAEMKHGPIALIDEGMPVVFVAPRDHTYDKVLANIEEVRGRRARVIAIATEGDEEIGHLADHVIHVPATLPLLSPLLTTIPLQLLAYHAAVLRGMNVDKPRNLAKSVTVE